MNRSGHSRHKSHSQSVQCTRPSYCLRRQWRHNPIHSIPLATTLRASDLHNARATILNPFNICIGTWWRHQMETFSALLAICAGNSPVPGEFPAQRPETRSFDVFFDLRLNKRLRKQSWGWWFETLSWPLWRHRNELSLKMQLWLVRRRLAAILVLKLMI